MTLNIKTKSCKYKELNHEQMLLVFVNLLNNNNFSVKYIHLKGLFFGKETVKFIIDLLDGERYIP